MPGYDSATQMMEMTTTVGLDLGLGFSSYVFASQFAFGQWFLQPWLGYSIVYGRLLKCALSHRPHSNLTNLSEKLLHPWTERVTMTIKHLATTKKKNVVLRSGHHSLRTRQDGPGLCGQISFRLKRLVIRTTEQRSFWKTLLEPEKFKNSGFAF